MIHLEKLHPLFDENFATRGELGASVSVWHRGHEVLSLASGWCDRQQARPWTAATPVLTWSATKGPAAACVLHAMSAAGLTLKTRICEVWPEFAAGGKACVTFAEALSHRAGIPVLDAAVSVHDHAAVAAALAAQPRHWPEGAGHGYGPRAFGFLLDELVRRIAGVPLGGYWREHFAAPLGLDFWIGLPAHRAPDAASVFPSRNAPPVGDPFYEAFATPGSFTIRAFQSPQGLHSVASLNTPEARAASFPGFGGIGTASALGKFYAMLANGGELNGHRFFQNDTLSWMMTTLSQSADRVLMLETAFSAGFMRDPVDAAGGKTRAIFGPSPSAFGHPGAGGSHAFADPENSIAFAYVMNQMEPGVLPGAKSLRLVEALYRA